MDSNAKNGIGRQSKRANLPKDPFANIALSLSGGGFRATSMHLGVLSYLHGLSFGGKPMLERVRILSTVSGGTFAGVKYVASLKRGETFERFYAQVLQFMTRLDLVEEALLYLADDHQWKNGRQRSLINAFASIYYREFESAHFGLLWDEQQKIHLKEICFNATEFHFALPFHFQKTEFHSSPNSGVAEFVGNRKIKIPAEVAREIRLADIIAASSCVPFGFEPINFPDDFTHAETIHLKNKAFLPKITDDGSRISYPIGLMDGGVDDNQGVDAVLAAEERMRSYPPEMDAYRSRDRKAVDLYIISDGTNPTMENYASSSKDKLPLIGTWSFKFLQHLGITAFLSGSAFIVLAAVLQSRVFVMFFMGLGTVGVLAALIFLIFSRGFTGLTRRLGVPAFFERRMRHVDKLKFATLNNLLANRRNSASQMITKVVIKQLRWFSFERVYGDKDWRPRTILNAAFELNREEVEKRKRKYPFYSQELLDPGEKIIEVSEKALRMGTTLWFTEGQLSGENNMSSTIIACGQFSMCFNLLEYFEKYLWHPRYQKDYEKYSPEIKESLARLHQRLLADWNKFREDPYWLQREMKVMSAP